MGLTIIPTTSAYHIAARLDQQADCSILYPEKNKDGKRHFPDGEVYMRLTAVHKLEQRVLILHSGQPHPNSGLMELELLLQILKDHTSHQVEVFFTYFPYSMQDNIFQPGETNAAEYLIRKLTAYYNVQRIYAIDPHFGNSLWVNQYPIVSVSALDLLRQAAEQDFAEILYKSPDSGGTRRTGINGVKKKRLHSFDSELTHDDGFACSVRGKTVAVIDDILETGGTLARFYETCRQCQAATVIALITHGALPSGVERIARLYDRLYLTNTVACPRATIDISQLIHNTIRSHG